jgi:hypothetical protein
MGSTKMYPGNARHILDRQKGSQGKKKQQILSFVSPARTDIIMCTYNVGLR